MSPSRALPQTTEATMIAGTSPLPRTGATPLETALEIAAPVLAACEERIDSVVEGLDGAVRPVVGHLVGAGGKRVRPLLVALSGLAFGAPIDVLAELGAAAELVHTATLLHDDVIDRGESRRGRPTANVRFGDGPPVLSGDYLYARVFKRLLSLGHHATLDHLASTVEAMVAGELLQLARRDDPRTTVAEAVAIAERKTASLFAFAAAEGARAGGASERQRRALALFGKRLGLAFQVLDDVLDFESGTGKSPLKDLHEGTFTVPVLLGRARDPGLGKLLECAATLPKNERDSIAGEIAARTARSGGVERARSFGRALALGARAALLQGAPASPARSALLDLNDELVLRRK